MPTPPGLVRAKQTERLVAALNPPAVVPVPRTDLPSATSAALPLLTVVRPARFAHRVVLIDDHGRVREATLFQRLGWSPGTSVRVTQRDTHLVVEADPDGALSLDPRGRLRLPDAARKFLGFGAGEAVVLSLVEDAGRLVVSPASVLDTLVVLDVPA